VLIRNLRGTTAAAAPHAAGNETQLTLTAHNETVEQINECNYIDLLLN